MSIHHRSGQIIDSGADYQSLSQAPDDGEENTTFLHRSLALDGEEAFAEELVAQEIHASYDSRIRWIHFVLGCAVLLPWNVIITATPFFLSRLEGSSLRSTFSSYLSTSFTISNFVFLAHATVTNDKSTNARRALLSIVSLVLLTLMFTVSTFVFTQAPAGLFFAFIISNGIAQAAAGSYLQASIISVASLFGPTAMQALMSGQAAVGVAVSAVQVISAATSVRGEPIPQRVSEWKPEERSALVFFALSTAFLAFSAGTHAYLVRLSSYKAVVGQFSHIRRVSRGNADGLDDDSGLLSSHPQIRAGEKREQLLRVSKANFIYNLGIAYVFVVTLAVFPPITMSIEPTNPTTHPLLFSTIHFLVFNVGDLAGRYMCSIPQLIVWSSRRLLSLSLGRTLFIPVFLMCNIQRGSIASPSTAFISSDVLYMLILLLFGLSNGYVSSLFMMSAPSVEHNPYLKGRVEDVDVAATVAGFFLIGGLVIGSFASFAVRAAICDCNPFRGM